MATSLLALLGRPKLQELQVPLRVAHQDIELSVSIPVKHRGLPRLANLNGTSAQLFGQRISTSETTAAVAAGDISCSRPGAERVVWGLGQIPVRAPEEEVQSPGGVRSHLSKATGSTAHFGRPTTCGHTRTCYALQPPQCCCNWLLTLATITR